MYDLNPKDSKAWGPDGRTAASTAKTTFAEIVAYAKARYITIVPEIDVPGHSGGALSAYPEFGCTGKPFDTDQAWQMGIFCVGNDAAFEFIEGIFSELIDLFPGKYIHIGGDEVWRDKWKACPKCQARMHREGLKDEKELQSYFTRRIEKFLNGRNRTLIGWDEILEGGLRPMRR